MIEIGDVVKINRDNPSASFLQKGDEGEVMYVDNEGWVAVQFDFVFSDAHSCDGHCTNGWWIESEALDKLK